MRLALGEATRALAIDAAAIELSEGDSWPVRFAEGLPTEALGSPLIGEPVIARLVALSGDALVLDDAAGHETVGPFAAHHGIRSLAVPLLLATRSSASCCLSSAAPLIDSSRPRSTSRLAWVRRSALLSRTRGSSSGNARRPS